MRKRLSITLVALVAVAIPAVGFAEKFSTQITIHADEEPRRIFGVVRSPDVACEKRREVRLFGPDFNINKGNGQEYRRYALTRTNRFGEYEFEGGFAGKRGDGGRVHMPPGDYFTRALRKDFTGDVCRYDDSHVVTLGGLTEE